MELSKGLLQITLTLLFEVPGSGVWMLRRKNNCDPVSSGVLNQLEACMIGNPEIPVKPDQAFWRIFFEIFEIMDHFICLLWSGQKGNEI